MRRTRLKSKGKSETSKLQKKCDALLTPLAKKRNPCCEACGDPTQVGHHWIEKSRSSYLRYEMDNIISLCNSCHSKIHNRFGNSVMGSYDVADMIRHQRGEDWFQRMMNDSKKLVKVNKAWYEEHFERLSKQLNP